VDLASPHLFDLLDVKRFPPIKLYQSNALHYLYACEQRTIKERTVENLIGKEYASIRYFDALFPLIEQNHYEQRINGGGDNDNLIQKLIRENT
jgi:hypothetical protein